MGLSTLFLRGVRFMCRPFVKLDNKLQRGLAKKQKKQSSKVEIFEDRNNLDEFFSSISVITHAGGGIQGIAYLNCKEAFPFYYEKGNRVFEYDVDQSDDGEFILAHGDTEEERAEILDQRFTPLAIKECFDIINSHHDIKVIFDCKFKNLTAFSGFIKENLSSEALKRVVIQVFNEENVLQVKSIYDFKMLHVCMLGADYYQTAKTCVKYNIGAVSIPQRSFIEREGYEIFEKNNICVFAYTVNTIKKFSALKQKGITGIFSDFLFESDLKRGDDK